MSAFVILLELRMKEVVVMVTVGTIRRAKLQSNRHYNLYFCIIIIIIIIDQYIYLICCCELCMHIQRLMRNRKKTTSEGHKVYKSVSGLHVSVGIPTNASNSIVVV